MSELRKTEGGYNKVRNIRQTDLTITAIGRGDNCKYAINSEFPILGPLWLIFQLLNYSMFSKKLSLWCLCYWW